MTNLLQGRIRKYLRVYVLSVTRVLSDLQELTWEVHLCPVPGAVGLASAAWARRLRRQSQTAPRCDWLVLCPCYSSRFSPAVCTNVGVDSEHSRLRHNILRAV